MKLVSEVGRFALKDNSMIFGNIVWICDHDEKRLYHLIGENNTDEIDKNMDNYLVIED